uniref:SFRICE_038818 n=1 Tax=Spodoptera frugiperda TaxID=7108 RepID=A0A2H1WQC1_SPOFR
MLKIGHKLCYLHTKMFKNKIFRLPAILRSQNNLIRNCTTTSQTTDDEKARELERIAKEASIDEPPTSCCQSGCANCVYIVWAEALSAKIQNVGPEVSDKILDMVQDPSMKAYLEMELRIRGLKK